MGAQDAQRSRTALLWNAWVLLAMPAVWLGWAVLAFVVAAWFFVLFNVYAYSLPHLCRPSIPTNNESQNILHARE